MKHCVVCKKDTEPLVLINVRKDGKILFRRFVHPDCYANNQEWVKKQVHGKNPKYFVMGQKV